jgi:hypothetical protein
MLLIAKIRDEFFSYLERVIQVFFDLQGTYQIDMNCRIRMNNETLKAKK